MSKLNSLECMGLFPKQALAPRRSLWTHSHRAVRAGPCNGSVAVDMAADSVLAEHCAVQAVVPPTSIVDVCAGGVRTNAG